MSGLGLVGVEGGGMFVGWVICSEWGERGRGYCLWIIRGPVDGFAEFKVWLDACFFFSSLRDG